MGFKGSRKGTPFAAQQAADSAAKKAMDHGLRSVQIFVRGPGAGRESALRALQSAGFNISLIKDVTQFPTMGVVRRNEGGFDKEERLARYTESVCRLCRRENLKLF